MKKIFYYYIFVLILLLMGLSITYSFLEPKESLEVGRQLLFVVPVFFLYVVFIPIFIVKGTGGKLTLFFINSKLFKKIVVYELLSMLVLIGISIVFSWFHFILIIIAIVLLGIIQIIMKVCIKEKIHQNINFALCGAYAIFYLIIVLIYSGSFVNNNNFIFIFFNMSAIFIMLISFLIFFLLGKRKKKLKTLKQYIDVDNIKFIKSSSFNMDVKLFVMGIILVLIYRGVDFVMINGAMDTDMALFLFYSFFLQIVIIFISLNYFNNYCKEPIFIKLKKLVPLFVILIFASLEIVNLLFSNVDNASSIVSIDFFSSFIIVCFLLVALFLYRAKNYKRLLMAFIVVIVLKLLGNGVFIALFDYIGFSQMIGAIFTTFLAYFVGFLVLILHNVRDMKRDTQKVLGTLFNLCLLFVFLAFIIVVLNSIFFNSFSTNPFNSLVSLIVIYTVTYFLYKLSYDYL